MSGSFGQIRAQRFGASLASTRWRVAIAGSALLAGAVGAALAPTAPLRAGLGLALAVGTAATLLVAAWARASARAEREFLAGRGAGHGLRYVATPEFPGSTAILRRGDERSLVNGLIGPLAGRPGGICHYTYTDVSYTTDANGNRQRREADHDYTVAWLTLPTPGLRRLSLEPRGRISAARSTASPRR